jgi:hypothetical protein
MHCHCLSPSLGRGTTAGVEQPEGHDDGLEEPPAEVTKDMLQRRADIMFSGKTGEVVSSAEGLATSAPSRQLIADIIEVVDGLPNELFDRHAAHRPCGLLDRLGSYGMLLWATSSGCR